MLKPTFKKHPTGIWWRKPNKRGDSDSACLVLVCARKHTQKPGNRKLFLEHIFHFLDTHTWCKVVFPFAGVCRIRLAETLLAKISPHSGNTSRPTSCKGGLQCLIGSFIVPTFPSRSSSQCANLFRVSHSSLSSVSYSTALLWHVPR